MAMKLLGLTSVLSNVAAVVGLKAPTVKEDAVASTATCSHREVFIVEAIRLIPTFSIDDHLSKLAPLLVGLSLAEIIIHWFN
jgi:hypothetical protein